MRCTLGMLCCLHFYKYQWCAALGSTCSTPFKEWSFSRHSWSFINTLLPYSLDKRKPYFLGSFDLSNQGMKDAKDHPRKEDHQREHVVSDGKGYKPIKASGKIKRWSISAINPFLLEFSPPILQHSSFHNLPFNGYKVSINSPILSILQVPGPVLIRISFVYNGFIIRSLFDFFGIINEW